MATTARTKILEIRSTEPTCQPKLLERVFLYGLRHLQGGSLLVRFPSGAQAVAGDTSCAPHEMVISNPGFFGKVLSSGSVGFGEAYVDGDWETSDLTGLLRLLARNQPSIGALGRGLSWMARNLNRMHHRARRNTLEKSQENIQEHYDLSNDFYACFLDSSMTYSSALFEDYYESLEKAQNNKIACMLDEARVQAGDHILEIGSGWGALALAAARRGCRVTTITLSEEQHAYARKLFEDEGVADRVEIKLLDYRKLEGQFDAVVSCEMIEAVGKEYLPSYFETIQRSLKPGAKAVIQAITIPDARYENYCRSCDWIQKHIFPGGHLPSPGAIRANAAAAGGLQIGSVRSFGRDYGETLNRWAKAFNRNTEKIFGLGFDETFRRKWNYYFSYCEAGFEEALIDVQHYVLQREG